MSTIITNKLQGKKKLYIYKGPNYFVVKPCFEVWCN